jgi:AcrR family transcriptional regulator
VSNSSTGGPIWARPEPGSRRPRFSRAQIAAVAFDIADQEGFDAVSMRRVATELNAGTMTLYNYVRTKDDLLALMHDALMAKVLVPDEELPTGWRAALTAIARRTHAALVRHPWAIASLQGTQFGPNAMRHFEQYLAAVADTGLDTRTTFDLLTLVNSYVTGNALITTESRQRGDTDPEAVKIAVEFGLALLQTGEFPHTAALLGDREPTAAGPPVDESGLADQFERGLQALLDGATAQFGLPEA